MTREDILKEFKVDKHGLIRDRGKFEGEMLYAPYFYDLVMNGDGEDVYAEPDDTMFGDLSEAEQEQLLDSAELLYTELDVMPDDHAEFPELDPATTKVRVHYSDQGFVHVEEV